MTIGAGIAAAPGFLAGLDNVFVHFVILLYMYVVWVNLLNLYQKVFKVYNLPKKCYNI